MRSGFAIGSAVLLALVVGAGAAACGGGGGGEVDNTALRERMSYLGNLAEVSWVDFESGNVFIGFDERPPGLAVLVNTAAATAHKTHGKKVHVYAVRGSQPGWRPGDGGVLCEASVKLGVPGKLCM